MKTILDYADLVKEQHALNTTIAPVETDLTSASQAYAVGQKFIYDGVLYQAKTAIAQGAALVLNTNYEAADDVSSEIEALTNKLNNEVTTRAGLGAHNLFGVGNSLDEWFAATNDGKLPTSYLASETITGTVDKDTNSIVITNYNNTGYRWGCKKINLKKNTSYTFSRTSCDGTIQLFGKNNADDRAVVISGLSNGGTVNSGDYDWWYVGFYPTRSGGYFSITDLLVKLETDADTTFQPYAKTNQELTAENQTLTNEVDDIVNVLGSKNLLPTTAKTQTFKGVTFTKNSDGSVTANGTATEEIGFTLARIADLGISGNCILSGCTGGDSENTFALVITNEVNKAQAQETSEITVNMADYSSPTYPTSAVYILIKSGVTISNKTFYPMLRPASIEDGTYVPYSMTNREMTPYAQAQSNPNLLDNPWFTVNQRGASGALSSAYGYDRWQMNATIVSGGISMANTEWILQMLESNFLAFLNGKTVTASVLYSDGTMSIGTGDYSNTSNFTLIDDDKVHVGGGSYNLYGLGITAKTSLTIKAVKLELGLVSTLASDTAPNYATELLKCQRYFVRIGKDGEYVGLGMGQARSQTLCSVHIPSPVQMRAKPTLTISGNVILRNGNNIFTSTSGNVDSYPANEVILALTTTGLTAGSPYDVFTSNNNAYIDLSADL